MMISSKEFLKGLNQMVPKPKCELNYTKDYELLIAVVLSAQSTDKRVNEVTKELFKYNITELAELDIETLAQIIKSVGTYHKKAGFIQSICRALIRDYQGRVPNNRSYLEQLDGVGRKSCNVVLSLLFEEPALAVDTHVTRVAKRLSLAAYDDLPFAIESKLMKFLPKKYWNRCSLQMVLFGRYFCKSRRPRCSDCKFKAHCNEWTSSK